MASGQVIDNALGWAHFKLRGGWMNIVTTTIAYVTIISSLILVCIWIDPRPSSVANALYGWMMVLMVLQILILVVPFACSTICNAIRKDTNTHMLESHRLMPISGTEAVAGYMIGSTAQAVSLGLATLVIGIIVANLAKISVGDWLLANAILFVFAVCVWVTAVALSLVTQAALGLLSIFIVMCAIANVVPFVLLPGLTVLCGPMLGETIFGIIQTGGSWSWAYQVSFAAQFMAFVFGYIAAARKFRREDVQAFSPLLGLAVLLAWIVVSMVGIWNWPEFQPTFMVQSAPSGPGQLVASTLAAMLVALLPIASAVKDAETRRRRERLKDRTLGRRPMPAMIIILISAGLVLGLPWATAPRHEATSGRLIPTLITILLFLVACSYLMRIVYRVNPRSALAITIWIFFFWLGPLFIDYIRFSVLGGEELEEFFGLSSACSPIGTLMYTWADWENSVNIKHLGRIGLAVQFIQTAGIATVFYITRKQAADQNKSSRS